MKSVLLDTVSAITMISRMLIRERPLFCALFTIRTTFGLILIDPPTVQFEHRGQLNAHTLKDTFVFRILVHVS